MHHASIGSSKLEDISIQLEREKVARLRKTFDTVKELCRSKRLILVEMRSSSSVRDTIDDEVVASLDGAEMTMNALEDRYVSLSAALSEASELNKCYSKLISFLKIHVPFSDSHMASLEQEVILARQQLSDLKTYRRSLYSDIEKLNSQSIVSLKEKIKAIKVQRKNIHFKIVEIQADIGEMEQQLQVYEDRWKQSQKKKKAANSNLGLVPSADSASPGHAQEDSDTSRNSFTLPAVSLGAMLSVSYHHMCVLHLNQACNVVLL